MLQRRYMRFWLNHYSDDEIAYMASGIHNIPIRPDLVALRRLELL